MTIAALQRRIEKLRGDLKKISLASDENCSTYARSALDADSEPQPLIGQETRIENKFIPPSGSIKTRLSTPPSEAIEKALDDILELFNPMTPDLTAEEKCANIVKIAHRALTPAPKIEGLDDALKRAQISAIPIQTSSPCVIVWTVKEAEALIEAARALQRQAGEEA